MKLSENGAHFIKVEEGYRDKAYQCSANRWTIGYGHTSGVREGDRITAEQGEAFFQADVARAEECVNSRVKIALTQGQFDALVSFVFNFGCTRFAGSTLLRLLNMGEIHIASLEFPKWNKERKGGKLVVNKGLAARREREREMFLS